MAAICLDDSVGLLVPEGDPFTTDLAAHDPRSSGRIGEWIDQVEAHQ